MVKKELIEEILKQVRQPLWENWYLKERIGFGSFSEVYRAEAKRSDRVDEAAVKIEPVILDDGQIIIDEDRRKATLTTKKEAIEHEASIMYELRGCSNIVTYEEELTKELYVDGKFEGYYFLIRMELLDNVFEKMRANTFDYTERNVVKLAEHIGQGLMVAHLKGIIHRDIKPANFFVSKSGTYKLGDFNISKRTASTRSFAGTEGYMAPEIFSAKVNVNDSYTDQADIYSLGICLYQMMNGGLFPFEEASTLENAIERRMQGGRIPAPKNASEEFAKIILKACEYDTARRYRSMGEMLADIDIYQKGGKIKDNSVSEERERDRYRDKCDENQTVYADAYNENQTVYAESESKINEEKKGKNKNTKRKSRVLIGQLLILLLLLGGTFFTVREITARKASSESISPLEEENLTPSPTSEAKGTSTPVPSPTSELKMTSTPVPSPTSELKMTSTPVPSPTSEAKATSTPVPSPTSEAKATSTPVPSPTSELKMTSTPVPSPTSELKATSTPVPSPTNTLKPTKVPPPLEVEMGNIVPFLEECAPYEVRYAGIEDAKMCGDTYKNVLVLKDDYGDSWAYFNLKGKYTTIEFDLSHVDGTDMSTKTLQVYLDGEQKYAYEVRADGYIQHVEVDVRGVKQLRFYTDGLTSYGRRTTSIGLANLQAQ